MDTTFLARLSECPSVATACRPVAHLAETWLGEGYTRHNGTDSFVLFTRAGAPLSGIRCLLVAHMDEIGGCALGARPDGLYDARCWGCHPLLFAEAELQGIDYLSETDGDAFVVHGEVAIAGQEPRLVLRGPEGLLRPYRTVWTFREEAGVAEGFIEGKALDPRATVFAALSALKKLNDPRVGAMLVMAEECAMDVARKGVGFLHRNVAHLRLIVNADVPSVANLADADLEVPAIRVFEGRNFVDPGFGIHIADRLQQDGVIVHLTSSRTGSQTPLFGPLAPTVSVALPGLDIHTRRARMSLLGIERCIRLLQALASAGVSDERPLPDP